MIMSISSIICTTHGKSVFLWIIIVIVKGKEGVSTYELNDGLPRIVVQILNMVRIFVELEFPDSYVTPILYLW